MRVVGYDPGITVRQAWQLDSAVQQANSVEDLLARADFVTFHVPLIDATRNMINEERLRIMKKGVIILNFARHGIIDDNAVVAALDSGKVYGYICDFPSNLLKNHKRVITLPHLGASTAEAEDNCAIMVAEQVRDYLENGNVVNSVNFPEVVMSRSEGAYRLSVVNSNVPNMLGQISSAMATAGYNIIDMLNRSRGDLAYTLVDVDKPLESDLVTALQAIEGVRCVRVVG
jgi:D-3-phosphoglycerate dehydrogenase / 2-oxoglutarate reductase